MLPRRSGEARSLLRLTTTMSAAAFGGPRCVKIMRSFTRHSPARISGCCTQAGGRASADSRSHSSLLPVHRAARRGGAARPARARGPRGARGAAQKHRCARCPDHINPAAPARRGRARGCAPRRTAAGTSGAQVVGGAARARRAAPAPPGGRRARGAGGAAARSAIVFGGWEVGGGVWGVFPAAPPRRPPVAGRRGGLRDRSGARRPAGAGAARLASRPGGRAAAAAAWRPHGFRRGEGLVIGAALERGGGPLAQKHARSRGAGRGGRAGGWWWGW
jgi:hypothetical protein